jgi:hypothetical protein
MARLPRRPALLATLLVAALPLPACRGDSTGPSAVRVTLEPFSVATQYGLPRAALADPIAVRAVDATRGGGVENVEVQWRIVAGNGASLVVLDARTDEFGIARARLTLGADTGRYVVEADAQQNVGSTPGFEAFAIVQPHIDAVAPANFGPRDTIVVTGAYFRPDVADRAVRVGGVRGRILSGSDTELVVEAPACMTDRMTTVQVMVGAVGSETALVQTRPSSVEPIRLELGEARVFRGDQLGCVRLAAESGLEYLLISQNVHGTWAPGAPFELVGFTDGAPPAASPSLASPIATTTPALEWEARLRTMEARWRHADVPDRTEDAAAAVTAQVRIGDRRDFNVLLPDLKFTRVTGVVRHISTRAIIYEDLAVPAGGLSENEYASFASVFDDPIFPTTAEIFGQPSDIDGNGRVIILFTPRVNALTPASAAGYIAAYFYGCDLVERSRCSGSNRGEIFYTMVPDPEGRFGKSRTREDVRRTVPSVLAHELQHMVHFAQKGQSLDLLWLSEALAHAAEDVVAAVFAARGDTQNAADFRTPNYMRARAYLEATQHTSLIAENTPGTLEMRGGAWLLLKYLTGHYGGTALLGELTRASAFGIANLEQRTGRGWAELLVDFGIALFADGMALPVGERHTFRDFTPRQIPQLGGGPGGYVLRPTPYPAASLASTLSLGASSQAYGTVTLPAWSQAALQLVLTGARGGAFPPTAEPQLVVLRVR